MGVGVVSQAVVPMPNPETDAIRRFTVVAIEHKPDKGRPWASAFVVRDRCGFLPDTPFPVASPKEGKRPATDAEEAARNAAEERRRNLNLCEHRGHNFPDGSTHCVQCGGQP
jgi:hypothetical protein